MTSLKLLDASRTLERESILSSAVSGILLLGLPSAKFTLGAGTVTVSSVMVTLILSFRQGSWTSDVSRSVRKLFRLLLGTRTPS